MDTRILQLPIQVSGDTVIVNCQNIEEYRQLRQDLPELLKSASSLGAKKLAFRVGSKTRSEVPTSLGKSMSSFRSSLTPEILLRELLQAGEEGRSLSLVEMGTDRQVFCTSRHENFCGASWHQWIGMSAREFFPDTEYSRYMVALNSYERISQFSYRAFRIDTREERLFTVDARIITTPGRRQFRLVETLSDEPVPAI
ncbi:MAG: hypothetical protein F6K42_18880 [Leptolyngbya sp. SIO1D8]|nr:hypothetical protein [Leptolyngbya sp. SIO1D8]